jgi:DNA modification methylase
VGDTVARRNLYEGIAYQTDWGMARVGRSEDLLLDLDSHSVDLIFTSPPFALQRGKAYGNLEQGEWLAWMSGFGPEFSRILKPRGSLVLDLGGAYQKGQPVRSLANFRLLINLCDNHGFHLAEDFYWYNPARLPSPIEWVNKRKIRAKDAVNNLWWLSQDTHPKADIKKVLVPYSDRMKRLLEKPSEFFSPTARPSGHQVVHGFEKDNGGAIPPNLLQIANTESNSSYLRRCKAGGFAPHPARFPEALPDFFIRFLTEPGDLILDPFAGSNTTGKVAEKLGRRWHSWDCQPEYVYGSVLRFGTDLPDDVVIAWAKQAQAGRMVSMWSRSQAA